MTNEQVKPNASLARLASLELASADAPDDIETRLSLIDGYRRSSLSEAASVEMTRLSCMHPNHPLIMAENLRVLWQRQAMQLLSATLARAQALANPPPALRASMAVALTRLRQFDKAAVQFATLLDADCLPDEALEALAELVRLHPGEGPVASSLERISCRSDFTALPPLMQYSVARTLVESCPARAAEQLPSIRIEGIACPSTVLDLGILAFRLGQWSLASRAGASAIADDTTRPAAERLMVSSLSFAGHLEEAGQRMRASTDPPSPVQLTPSQLPALTFLASQYRESQPVWGVVVGKADPRSPGRLITRWVEDLGDEDSGLPEDPSASLTVSAIRPGCDTCSPWDILAAMDWRAPHMMIQHVDVGAILHAFVAATDAPESWAWQEVPVAFPEDTIPEGTGFRHLAAGASRLRNPMASANALWRRVEEELDGTTSSTGVES